MLLLLEGLQLGHCLLDLILHEKLGGGLGRGLSGSASVPSDVPLSLHEHVVLQLLLEGRLLSLQRLLQHIQFLTG